MAEYRIVKIEDCNWPDQVDALSCAWARNRRQACVGCQGDGTRMVDVARVERRRLVDDYDDEFVWVEVESWPTPKP